MKVPISLFLIWAICLVGIVIGFGKSGDAFTIQGYHIWKIVGIVSAIGFVAGIIWYFAKSGGSSKQ